MTDYMVQKGEEGENYVNDIINQVLPKMDYTYIIVRNKIFPFESVYGRFGYISAEFDFVVFTPYYIFIIEVKNESYSEHECSNPLWKLMDGTKVPNPISQNHFHKQVFCSELKVPLNNVITIEILLENVDEIKGKRPQNDYVFLKNGLENNLLYLLSSENDNKHDCCEIYERFIKLVNAKKIDLDDHIKNLNRTEKIETRIRNVLGYIPLRRTDIVKCDRCETGKLVFREYKDKGSNAERQSKRYALGCTNYENNIINCKGLIFIDKDQDTLPFSRIKPISIEGRNGWNEEQMNQTVLNEINALKDEINALKRENRNLSEQIVRIQSAEIASNRKDSIINDLQNRLKQVNEENENNKSKLSQFKRLFGRYYKRSKTKE